MIFTLLIEVILQITLTSFSARSPMNFIAMKEIILSILLCTAVSTVSFCQLNKEALIKEAEEKLKINKASISQILTDKKYDAVHPETSFRELIKKYCKSEAISIASDTIPGKKIKVFGTVKNAEGKPIADALVYLYHTDARGWYAADAPHVSMNEVICVMQGCLAM